MKHRLIALKRTWKNLWRPALSSLLIITIILTGVPLFPGWGTERVLAATTAGINPNRIVPVYGGQSEIYWNYGQKTHSTSLERCEVTPIPPEEQGEPYEDENGNLIYPPTHTKVSLGTIGSKGAGSPGETERYEWNGNVSGKPLSDGSYTICIVPSGAPEYFGYADVNVENPNPPAPAYIQVVPSLDANGRNVHKIRGIAENGTQVNVNIAYTKREGYLQVPNPEANQELTVNVPFGKMPDSSHLTWSKEAKWQTETLNLNSYFTNFPLRDDNKPEQYIREWEVEVELEPYQSAIITATAERTDSNPYYNGTNPSRNQSNVSEVTAAARVLRYIAPDWDINWEALSGYYYKAFNVEGMIAGAERIAADNGIAIGVCTDGQRCSGFITKGWNLIIREPEIAGEISQKEFEEDLTFEKISNRENYPSPLWWDPINLATGDFIFSHTNMSLSAIMPLDFTLTYHSRDKYNGAVGVGWHHSFEWRLVPSGEGMIKVITPDGANYLFEEMSDGSYRTPAGTYETLKRNADGTFEMTTPQRISYKFREDGNLLRITDSNENHVDLTYEGAVLKKVETIGASMSFDYGEAGKIASVTDQTGRSVNYEYDPLTHDLLVMRLPDGGAIRYEYDDRHQITTITNPNNTATLENRYDEEGRVVYQKDFSGAAGTIEYDSENRKTITTDPLGRVKTFEFDERFRQTAIHYPDGTTERFEYDSNDNMILFTDRNGEDWTYVYDTFGNLLQQADPLGHTTTIYYNGWNKPSEIVDALGNETQLEYDSRGNLTTITDALGNVSKIEFDSRGVPTTTINAAGERLELTNDNEGFVRFVTDPEGYTMELIRDGLHRVTAQIDPMQARTNIVYDPRDRVLEQTNALGFKESLSYDKNSNMTGVVARNNGTYSYKYDNFDRVSTMTDAAGNVTTFEYDAVGNQTKIIEPNGAVTQYFYDETNRLVRAIDAESNETVYEYDGNGNITAVIDPRSGRTEVVYDARNLPIQVKDAEGGITTYEYDALGQLVAETDHYGAATFYQYNALGQLAKVVDALGQETAYQYDKVGRLTEVTQPNGAIWAMEYDKRGLLIATIDPIGQRATMERDELGRVTVSRDELGVPTTYTYDALGRVTSMTDAQGSVSYFSYNALDQITAVQDALGRVTSYAYDALGRLVSVINANGDATTYTYDVMGNLRSKTDAEGRTTVYEYDLLSRLKLEMDPLGQVTSVLYDGMGNVTSVTNPDQTTTAYEYDLASRLVGINYQDGASVSYTYDKLGRRTSMVDSTGTTSYTYDLLSRLTSVTDGRGQTIRYSWTENGQRESMTYPDGSVVNYEVDLLDRIVGIIDSAGRRTSYEYDARGMLTTKTLPTGAMSTYVYDELGQLLELTHRNQQGKSVEQLIYAYDPLGNRTRMERIEGEDDEDDAEGGRVVSEYTYDALNQLITVSKYNAGDSGSTITTNYSYDKVGNRLTKATSWGDLSDVEQYTYNALDQLTRRQNGLNYKDYTYDPRGNLLKVLGVTDAADPVMTIEDLLPDPEAANPENAAVTDSVYTETGLPAVPEEELSAMSEPRVPQLLESYAWNSANRLIQHINEAGDITRYTYDGDDNRISMIVDLAHGPKGNGNNGNNGKGNNGNGNGNGNGNNNGNGNGNNGNGNGNGNKCDHVVPPGFVPPGLAKKCGQDGGDETETYPIEHPSGPRDGWEHQYKKQHQEYYFTNDVSMALPEAIQITGDNASEWKETFVYGAGGERVSYTYLPAYDANNGWEPTTGVSGTNAGAPKTLWYLTDALGSTLGLIEQDGRVSSRYHYDEFGVVLDDKKFDPNWPGPDNLYGYTGLGYDYTSGLTYARARYYQPEIGRFVSEDTYKGTLGNPQSQNLYGYVHNNPLRYIDPSGHMAVATLNDFLEDYIEGDYTQRELIDAVIKENGEGAIYTSFHEITQILFATKIYTDAGSTGDMPQLEHRVKKGEVDIYFDNQIWEVKAKYSWNFYVNWDAAWEDLEKQIQKYEKSNPDLTRGIMLEDSIEGIHIVGNLYMKIESLDIGKVGYSLYSFDKDGNRNYFTKSNAGPAMYVYENYFLDDDDDIDSPKKKGGGGKKKK